MDAVVFEGKEYLKASVLAKRFRYTQDYLGQLCRGKKVDARLVGRAWYINLESLEEHRTGRYKTSSESSEISLKKPKNNFLSRIDVEPVLKNKTVKVFREKNGILTELPVRYEKDDYSLIPKVNKGAVSASLPVLPAEAEKLKIKKEAKKFNITDFKAEPLPEVYLAGSLRVEGLEEAVEEIKKQEVEISEITSKIKAEHQEVPKRIISIRQPQRKSVVPKRVDMRPVERVVPSPVVTVRVAKKNKIPQVTPEVVKTRMSSDIQQKRHNIALQQVHESADTKQKIIQKKNLTFSPDIVVARQTDIGPVQSPSMLFVTGVVLGALLLSGAILSTKSQVLVGENSYAHSFSFDVKNISEILSLLK